MVAVLSLNNATSVITGSTGVTGWTLLDSATSGTMQTFVYTKVAVAADAGKTARFQMDTPAKYTMTIAVYSGDMLAPQFAKASETTTQAGHTTPTIEAGPGDWALSYWADKSSATTAFTLPPEVTQRQAICGTSTGRICSALADSNAGVAAGTVRRPDRHLGRPLRQRDDVDDPAPPGDLRGRPAAALGIAGLLGGPGLSSSRCCACISDEPAWAGPVRHAPYPGRSDNGSTASSSWSANPRARADVEEDPDTAPRRSTGLEASTTSGWRRQRVAATCSASGPAALRHSAQRSPSSWRSAARTCGRSSRPPESPERPCCPEQARSRRAAGASRSEPSPTC